jgi:hypothetical protein
MVAPLLAATRLTTPVCRLRSSWDRPRSDWLVGRGRLFPALSTRFEAHEPGEYDSLSPLLRRVCLHQIDSLFQRTAIRNLRQAFSFLAFQRPFWHQVTQPIRVRQRMPATLTNLYPAIGYAPRSGCLGSVELMLVRIHDLMTTEFCHPCDVRSHDVAADDVIRNQDSVSSVSLHDLQPRFRRRGELRSRNDRAGCQRQLHGDDLPPRLQRCDFTEAI